MKQGRGEQKETYAVADIAHRQIAYRLEWGNKWVDYNLVFPNSIGKPASPKNFMDRSFKPICKAVDVHPDFTFHDLRHTHATLMLRANTNPKVVSERLGHSSVKITLDIYSHVIPGVQRQAVEAFEKLLDIPEEKAKEENSSGIVQ